MVKQRRHGTPLKQKKSLKNWLINLLLFIMLVIGLGLVFNNQIKNFLVKQMSHNNGIEKVSRKEIAANLEKDVSFDFAAVQSLDFEAVVKSRLYQDELYVIGGIAIPDVQLNLPIFKGLSNYALIAGAGTMKDGQVMGEGNYALASHHMIQEDLLFGPLALIPDPNQGETLIYLTDLDYIYEYKVTYKEFVDPDRSDLVEDVANRKMLTLVTCDTTGAQRLIIQAELTKKTANTDASEKVINAFNLDKNTY